MSEDLKVLFPEEIVQVAGEPIKVHPFFFGQLSRVAKFCRPIVETLISSKIMTITKVDGDDTSTIRIDKDFVPKLLQILDGGSEPLLCLVAYAVSKPREWLDSVPADDGIALTQKIWEVNSNFFVERVLPMIAAKLTGLVSTGATSLQDSSEQAIAATTSTATP